MSGLKRQSSISEECHVMTEMKVLSNYGTDIDRGLSAEAVKSLRDRFGPNRLDEEPGKSLFRLVIEQFDDLLVKILLLAALLSFGLALIEEPHDKLDLTSFVEPIVILVILILNAVVGVWQESNAEQALDALKKLQPETASCLRDGMWNTINAEDLVPGDIVDVRVGDKIPADMRILRLKSTSVRAEQSQLTGESKSVEKLPIVLSNKNCEIQSKVNCLFASTTIANGHAVCCVTATGMRTEIGKVQTAVKKAGEEEISTPLQIKLDEFGVTLSRVIFVICVVVWVINYKNFSDPVHGTVLRGCIYYFKIAVALAVAAIPEGLPAVITTCLALGTRKMAKKNAIVRRLPSIETLGCTTVICSDKTGTLTTNQMCAVELLLPISDHKIEKMKIEGCSYTPQGAINVIDSEVRNEFLYVGQGDHGLQKLATCAALCNESRLLKEDGKYSRQGEPTEAAIKVLVEKLGCPDKALNKKYLGVSDREDNNVEAFCNYWSNQYTKYATLEFTRDRKSMSVICRRMNDLNMLYVKGAPEAILERCCYYLKPNGSVIEINSSFRKTILEEVKRMGNEALRTIAFAYKNFEETSELARYTSPLDTGHALLSDPNNFENVEKDMIFIGMIGIVDPPRPEVKNAIQSCQLAGIRVIMITGDNKQTAEAIAKKVGIISGETEKRWSFTGKEFESLSAEDQLDVLRSGGGVFSRTEPKHKQIIIRILRDLGEITAMTGDGVNDAPALKQADIGIAMGITGTEVAKEASDMVLADDNFSTIVAAVEEGRSIYNNMKAFIRYLISSNIGEVASIFITSALGVPEGLAPVQLLWVNLVTDGPPATALGFNPPDLDVMQKPPRSKDDPLISPWVFVRYLIIGIYVGIATVGIFVSWYVVGTDPNDNHTLITMHQLMNWSECPRWLNFQVNPVFGTDPANPCTYFSVGKAKASTLSLTVLVLIEMLNALNALSENGSLLFLPPWANPWLILATVSSLLVHAVVLYVPFFSSLFGVVPLSLYDWFHVIMWSIPVIFIDEILKFFARRSGRSTQVTRLKKKR